MPIMLLNQAAPAFLHYFKNAGHDAALYLQYHTVDGLEFNRIALIHIEGENVYVNVDYQTSGYLDPSGIYP